MASTAQRASPSTSRPRTPTFCRCSSSRPSCGRRSARGRRTSSFESGNARAGRITPRVRSSLPRVDTDSSRHLVDAVSLVDHPTATRQLSPRGPTRSRSTLLSLVPQNAVPHPDRLIQLWTSLRRARSRGQPPRNHIRQGSSFRAARRDPRNPTLCDGQGRRSTLQKRGQTSRSRGQAGGEADRGHAVTFCENSRMDDVLIVGLHSCLTFEQRERDWVRATSGR